MKKIILSILLAASASSSLLLARNEYDQGTGTNQGTGCRKSALPSENQTGQRAELTANCQLPTANCDNVGTDLSCHLMMNPSTIENGTQALGEALGLLGKEAVTAERTMAEGEGAGRSGIDRALSSSNSSNQVLRLRGGGPKPKNKSTGGLKSTGESSDEDNADPDLESEDTQPMGSEVSKYLKKEIINNIYTECLAEVAKLLLGGNVTAESISKEEAEWAAAAQAAEYSKGKIERAFEKAEREIDEAKSTSDEAKRNVRELEKASKPASATEQAIAAANLAYEKAYAAHAASDYKAKKFAGELAEARVETANAVLHAITVRKGTQHATEAEAGLEAAKEAEVEALKAVEAAKVDVAAKAALMKSAEDNLNAAKKTAIGTSGTNPAPPMTAAQRVAMREIEEDKAIAEAAKSKAKKAELTANVAKDKIYEMNFERELKAYHDAEDAWKEAIVGYKTALSKVHEVNLDDEELTAALASAEVHQATWRAHCRWVKARQADQIIATVGASHDQFTVAETAWASAVEGYKMAVEKATKAKLKCVELMSFLNSAVSDQERVAIAQREAEAKNQEKIKKEAETILVREREVLEAQNKVKADEMAALQAQIEELKQSSLESKAKKDVSSDSFEQKALEKSINGFNEAAEYLNNAIRAISSEISGSSTFVYWKEVAARSKESAEQYIISAQVWTRGVKDEARRLDSAADLLLVQVRHKKYLAKANKAEASGNRKLAEKWNELERQNQQAVDPLTQSIKAYAEGKEDAGDSWNNAGNRLANAAESMGKSIEAEIAGQPEIAERYSEAARQFKCAVDEYTQSARAYEQRKAFNSANWNNIGSAFYKAGLSFYEAAQKLEKAVEAEIAGRTEMAMKWREVAEQQMCSIEPYTQAAIAYKDGKKDESECWNSAGNGFNYAAQKLEKAIEAEIAGKQELAKKYCEAAEQDKCSVVPYAQAARAYKDGKKDEGEIWNSAGNGFCEAAKKLEKAIEAESAGKLEEAMKWREVAEQHVHSIEFYNQIARTFVAGKTEENFVWRLTGLAFYEAAKKLEKAIEAEAVGKLEEALTWREAAEQYKRSIEPFTQSVKAYGQGKVDESKSWWCVGFDFYKTAEKFGKAIEAKNAGQPEVALKWREVADQQLRAVEPYFQAVRAYEQGKIDEAAHWNIVGKGFDDVAEKLEEAIEAEATRHVVRAEGLRGKAAKHKEKAEKLQEQGANTKCYHIDKEKVESNSQLVLKIEEANAKAGEASGCVQWYQGLADAAGSTTSQRYVFYPDRAKEKETEYYLKAVECSRGAFRSWSEIKTALTQEREPQTLLYSAAKYYAEAADIYSCAARNTANPAITLEGAECTSRSAEALKNQAERHEGQAKSLQAVTDYQAKAIEAEAAGKAALAVGYREAEATFQRAADQYKQSALAFAAGNSSEGLRLINAAKATQVEADAIAKRAE